MAIPDGLKNEGLKLSKGMLLFGEPIESMSKLELIALVALAHKINADDRKEHIRQLDVLGGFKQR